MEAGIEPSVGSVGNYSGNAMAETIIGMYKNLKGPWRDMENVEYETLVWVDWFNRKRILGPIDDIPPPVEYESLYYERQENPSMVVRIT